MCDNVSQRKPCVCVRVQTVFPSLSPPTFLVRMRNPEKYGLVDETIIANVVLRVHMHSIITIYRDTYTQ